MCPTSRAIYQTKAKNAQEAHEAIRPTDFGRDKAGSGDHARLYDLVWKRAMASQMASARLERTTIELTDGTGQHALRATGQVVMFPGYLALYEEGRDDEGDEESRRLPRMNEGDTPAKKAVDADQHFTQPPPRYSEASLVKRMEELGIGRPSTYASMLQVLKDRDYVRVEKNRFFAEESGRLVTAFLERFFERYVGYDFTAGLEDELDDVSGGRAEWQAVLEAFWRDFKPKTAEVMEQKPSRGDRRARHVPRAYLFPDKGDGSDPRLCPVCQRGQAVAARRPVRRVRRLLQLSRVQIYPQVRPAGRRGGCGRDAGPEVLGSDPETGEEVDASARAVRALYPARRRQGGQARLDPQGRAARLDLDWAVKLLRLPRTIGPHPESGKPITASIGRYGPYLRTTANMRRLRSTAEVFETGMNARWSSWPRRRPAAGARGARPRAAQDASAPHPSSGGEIKLMDGRYGPYVTDGTTNATLPETADPDALTPEEALALIDERAAKGPAKGKKPVRKAARRRSRRLKGEAKKAAVKKVTVKKAPKKAIEA